MSSAAPRRVVSQHRFVSRIFRSISCCRIEKETDLKFSLLWIEESWQSIQDKYFWAQNMCEVTVPSSNASVEMVPGNRSREAGLCSWKRLWLDSSLIHYPDHLFLVLHCSCCWKMWPHTPALTFRHPSISSSLRATSWKPLGEARPAKQGVKGPKGSLPWQLSLGLLQSRGLFTSSVLKACIGMGSSKTLPEFSSGAYAK